MEYLSACPICQKNDISDYGLIKNYRSLRMETFRLTRCNNCALQFINPRPSRDEIGRYYSKSYYKFKQISLKKSKFKQAALSIWFGYPIVGEIPAAFLQLSKIAKPLFKNKIGRLIPDYVENGRLLEIGCGQGDFLVKMRQAGWSAFGLDIGIDALKFAKRTYGLNVHFGIGDCLPFKNNYFDVVYMKHVIEHFHDPFPVFREIRRVLKKGGKVYITTPNGDSLGRRLFKADWIAYEPPYHLMIYNTNSMAYFLNHHGLKNRIYTPISDNASIFSRSFYFTFSHKGRISIRCLDALRFFIIFTTNLFRINLGEEIQAVSEK